MTERAPIGHRSDVHLEPTVRCAATTVDDYPCKRAGVHEEDGALYCTQHHPPRVAAAQDARHVKWERQMDWEQIQRRLASLRVDVADAALREPFDVDHVLAAVRVYRDERRRSGADL